MLLKVARQFERLVPALWYCGRLRLNPAFKGPLQRTTALPQHQRPGDLQPQTPEHGHESEVTGMG